MLWIDREGWEYHRVMVHNRNVAKDLAKIVRKNYGDLNRLSHELTKYYESVKDELNSFDRGMLKKAIKEITGFLRGDIRGSKGYIPGALKDSFFVMIPINLLYYRRIEKLCFNANSAKRLCVYTDDYTDILYIAKDKIIYAEYPMDYSIDAYIVIRDGRKPPFIALKYMYIPRKLELIENLLNEAVREYGMKGIVEQAIKLYSKAKVLLKLYGYI